MEREHLQTCSRGLLALWSLSTSMSVMAFQESKRTEASFKVSLLSAWI